jgi:hypothetical protein
VVKVRLFFYRVVQSDQGGSAAIFIWMDRLIPMPCCASFFLTDLEHGDGGVLELVVQLRQVEERPPRRPNVCGYL